MKRKRVFSAALALVFLLAQPMWTLAAESEDETLPTEAAGPAEPDTSEVPDTPPEELPPEPDGDLPDSGGEELPEPPGEAEEPAPDAPPEENPPQTDDDSPKPGADDPAPGLPPEADDPEPDDEAPDFGDSESAEPPETQEPPDEEPPEVPEAVNVEVSSSGELIFNPFGVPVELDGEVSTSQIISTRERLVNHGNTPVAVSASARASAPETSGITFVNKPVDDSIQGKAVFLYVEFQLVSGDDAPGWETGFTYGANQLPAEAAETEPVELFVLEPGAVVEYRVFGSICANLAENEAWDFSDCVNLSVNFAFLPELPDGEEPPEPTELPDEAESPNLPEPPEEGEPSDLPELPDEVELPDSSGLPNEEESPDSTEPPGEEELPDSTEPPGEEELPDSTEPLTAQEFSDSPEALSNDLFCPV